MYSCKNVECIQGYNYPLKKKKKNYFNDLMRVFNKSL